MNETVYWVWLVMTFGAANPHIWDLLSKCENVQQAYNKIQNNNFILTHGERTKIITIDDAATLISDCSKKNIRICTYNSHEYPPNLRSIYNPPAVLFVMGSVESFDTELSVTVVGTRNPSAYGCEAVTKITSELAHSGFTIISGFAAGIDSVAHRAALSEGGKTIAVLGCGIDVDYPKANSDIRSQIIKNGALVSEFLPGTPPVGKNFPIRNRILSGMSLGVFVGEAPLGSGALITADMAAEQGRDVFCIPPADIFDKKYQGVIKYLRDGAIPVFSHLDIIYEYYTTFSHKLSSLKPGDEYTLPVTESSVYSSRKKKVQPVSVKPKEKVSVSYDNLTEEQIKIIKLLKSGECYIDDISKITGIEISDLLVEVTGLEMAGIIQALPGRKYSLI